MSELTQWFCAQEQAPVYPGEYELRHKEEYRDPNDEKPVQGRWVWDPEMRCWEQGSRCIMGYRGYMEWRGVLK